MSAVVEIENLTKSFGEVIAVNHLNLTINQGEMFGIIGPDGAGKTTTFRMLVGVLFPTSGTAKILGFDILKELKKIKREIGYLSQRFSLYSDLTIDENIEFFAKINEVYDYKDRREELLAFTRLTPFRNRLAEQLSGGMKQKLALVCTLIHRPKILFLDEPTTGVDPVSRRDFWKILSSLLKENITIVLSTPYLDEAERCSRVALMNRGKMLVVDTPQNVKALMKGEIVEVICEPIRKAFNLLKGNPLLIDVQAFGDRLNLIMENSKRDFSAIEKVLKEDHIQLHECRTISSSLENVFISLLEKNRVL